MRSIAVPDRLDPVLLVLFGDCREAQNFPLLLAEDVADQVVFVQPLHDDDDGATALVVLPAVEGVVEPFVGGLPLRLGERLLRLQRIVDQDDVGPASGQHAAGGGGEPITLAGSDEFLHRLAVRRQAGRKHPPIPRAHHDAAAIASELIGERLGIADAEDLRRRVVPETPGRKSDRGHQRFEVTGRQVNDGRRILPSRTAVSAAAITSRCQFVASLVCGLRSLKQRPAKVVKSCRSR